MLIYHKRHFTVGALMTVVFVIILFIMSRPYFHGTSAFKAADRLFNSIAKGSSYKIEGLKQKAQDYQGTPLKVSIRKEEIPNLEWARRILAPAGGQAEELDDDVRITGDLGGLALAALNDADAMYYNDEQKVSNRYGISGKEALYTWWVLLKDSGEALKREKQVEQATFLDEVVKSGVEVGYNFYGISPEKASSEVGILVLSLAFYLAYTVWWGFAIFFLFEGFGLAMEAGEKEEM